MKPSKLVKRCAREALREALKHGADSEHFYNTFSKIQSDLVHDYALYLYNGCRNIATPGEIAGAELFAYRFMDKEDRNYKDMLRESLEELQYWRYESPFSALWPMFKTRLAALDLLVW